MDATPLLGERSGVGRYVTGLLEGLTELAESDPAEIPARPC